MTTQQPGNGIVRQGFGTNEMQSSGEMGQSSLAAAAQAQVQARFIMAMKRPRNWDDVRTKLLLECARPGFAAVARYHKPVGGGIKGPSIRFAEACFRYAGNMDAPVTTTYEDKFRRTVHASVIDLETNASYGADITVEKTVERRERKDRVVLGERKNTKGETVYIVEATEDEILNKQNAMVSKALRTEILRLIPGDIVEEGQQRCIEVLMNEDAKDPMAAKKLIVDNFSALGVYPSELAKFLAKPNLDVLQPAELKDLREAYATIRDGQASWKDLMDEKFAPQGDAANAAELERKLGGDPQPQPAQPTTQQRQRRQRGGEQQTSTPTAGSTPAASAQASDTQGPPAAQAPTGATPTPVEGKGPSEQSAASGRTGAEAATPPSASPGTRAQSAPEAAVGAPQGAAPPAAAASPPPTPATAAPSPPPAQPPAQQTATTAPAGPTKPKTPIQIAFEKVEAWKHPVGALVRHKDPETGVVDDTTTASKPQVFGTDAVIQVNVGDGTKRRVRLDDLTFLGAATGQGAGGPQ